MSSNKYRVLSLFSGAGGLDWGFNQNKNFKIIWAIDFEKDAVETYKNNIGDHIILGDIQKIKDCDIPKDVDVLLGGFPCQGFSIANTKRSMKDSRNFLYLEMIRFIKISRPKVFVAENVKGLLSMEKGEVLKMILNDFRKIGYEVDYQVLNSANYGVPQMRERVVIIGNRINQKNTFPKITHDFNNEKLKKFITVEESIGFLKDVETDSKPINFNDEIIYNHDASTNVLGKFWKRKYSFLQADLCDYLRKWREKRNISVKEINKILGYTYTADHWFRKDNSSGSIPKVSDWWKLKKILNFDDKFDKKVTEFVQKDITFEQSLRITNWNSPSDTITASQPEIHINKKRRLSVRECAILQGFPKDFVFFGSKSSMYKQVGNAVPPILSKVIANSILKMLEKN